MGSNRKLFSRMDNYIYELWMRQIKRWYNNKSVSWMVDKHFKISLHPKYNNKWTFTDPKMVVKWIKCIGLELIILIALSIKLHL